MIYLFIQITKLDERQQSSSMKYLFVYIIWLGIIVPGMTQDHIFNDSIPELISVWHRVADYSNQLRSVEAAELSPDGRWAVSGSKFGYQLMLWRVADGALRWERTLESEVECVAFSPDGQFVISGGEDYHVRLWEVATGKEVYHWEHSSSFDGITWSNNGNIIAGGTEEGILILWDASTYSQLGRIKTGSTINSLEFTQDDQSIVVGGNIQTPDPITGKTIYTGFATLIDVTSLEVLQSFEGHTASVKSVRLSPDEKYIATGAFDQTVRLFDLQTGELLHSVKEPLRIEAVAFTPDNQYLLTGGHQKKISFYRLSDLQLVYELPTPRTEYISFSQDGRLMLSAHEDSGLISLYLMLSDTQHRQGVYHRISNQQLNNRDLEDQERDQ